MVVISRALTRDSTMEKVSALKKKKELRGLSQVFRDPSVPIPNLVLVREPISTAFYSII
jgi:hypothetical protein